MTLAAGQTTIAVTLNGSGSSRPQRHHRHLQLDRQPRSGQHGQPHGHPGGGQLHLHPGGHRQPGRHQCRGYGVVTVNAAVPGQPRADGQCRPRPDGDPRRRADQHRVTLNGSGSSDPNGTISQLQLDRQPRSGEHGQPRRHPRGRHLHLHPGRDRQHRAPPARRIRS